MAIDKMNPAAAANAYANIQKTATGSSGETGEGTESGGGMSFGAMVRDAAKNTVETLKAGEKMSAAAVTGKADIADVVMAVTQAEQKLSEMVAIRDKVFNAYEEIMRMPI